MNIGNLIEGRASSDIISVEVGQSVREAVRILASKRIGALPVLEQGRVAGIFSERDVIHRLADEGEACLDRRVGEVMTSPAITVDRMTTIDDALGLMTRRRIRHLPVIETEMMCGFISIGDLVKFRYDEVQHEAEAMREYITHG
ncbi:CBS domain-containing protein [Qipengyuania gaetbuli]|uniref:CBS domain-containing protein n=1 Tax=Qipengyuania gaetbuli TaxID=266952 RepID=A0A844Y3K7_9SPHN|nr:CBS domain-containing protein [Qipengyuania gaetbuli]MBY6015270.1 CBS domain-containing protein [Qipengyuania gaetbuli]MXO51903.1 CBS domain-containing protein [Qipengyuania gaetbuli]